MKILIIITGGTFSKKYNELTGNLDINTNIDEYLTPILKYASKNIDFEIKMIINKDSLDFTDNDRKELLTTIQTSKQNNIIVIHGTDTMNQSANYIEQNQCAKNIIFVGAMHPISINPYDGIFNLASAIGFTNSLTKNSFGTYIAMHGLVLKENEIVKDYENGFFKVR